MKTTARVVAGSVVALTLATSLSAFSTEILEQVLVKVNGDIITKTDLEQRQIAALRGRVNADVNPQALRNDEELKKTLAEITPRLLVDAVDELLLLQLGREKGYRVTDQQFKDWVGEIRKNQGLEDEQKFEAALKQEGMTIEELRRNFERQVLIYRVQQDEVGSRLSITEEEARQYYLAHKQEFAQPASVTLREILVEVPSTSQQGEAGVNVAQDDAVKEKANEIRARLTAGEDFAKLAGEVSAAPSKANGGLIGPIQVKELSPALQQLLEKMKPGDISQPLRAARGYQILKLETMTAETVRPFESVRDLVADRVYADRQRTEMQKFVSRLRGQALIVWKNEELKKAYEQQVASMATAGTGGH